MKLDMPVCDIVGCSNSGTARVVIVKFPRLELAVRRDAAANVNYTRGTEVCPGHLLFARPDDLDRAFRCPRQARGLKRRVCRMLAPVGGAGVRHDHANAVLRKLERIPSSSRTPKGRCV